MIDLSNKSKKFILGLNPDLLNRTLNPVEIENIFDKLDGHPSWRGIGAYKYPIVSRIFANHIFYGLKLFPGLQPDRVVSVSPFVDKIVVHLAKYFNIKEGLTMVKLTKAEINPGEKILFVDYQESDSVYFVKAVIKERFPGAIIIPKVATIHGCYDVVMETEEKLMN